MNNQIKNREILKLLHPVVQEAILVKWQNQTGFKDIQRKSIPVILSGKSCLIISPTAGGKTEAAFLPALSNIYDSAINKRNIHIILIAPLKALLNDLEVRLQEWLDKIEDITLFKWHGDVSQGFKQKQRQKPASILLTTPESLDVMMVSPKINRNDYFREVRVVIVDEAHYFAGDSRGAQLASTIERIQQLALKPIQRIGLSATVGDPLTVLKWLTGSGLESIVVRAENQKRNIEIKHFFIDEDKNDYNERLKETLTNLTLKGKTIIFSNSRKDVEMTARILEGSEITVMVHHGSVSKILREEYEGIMRDYSGDAVISATSTLELGIDIGDLSSVIQRENVPSVNSYLQRIGRAGRRDGKAQISLIASSFEVLLLNIAISTLGSENYNEPIQPSKRRYDILFQQLLMEILGNSGISSDTFFEKVKTAFPFQEITKTDLNTLINYWIECNYIQRDGKALIIGSVVEERYSGRNYMELYSVFDANEYFTVNYFEEEIGLLDSWFAFALKPNESVFRLAGRKWKVKEVIHDLKKVYVIPAKDALPPLWRGGGNFSISYDLARRYHDILHFIYEIKYDDYPEIFKILNTIRKAENKTTVPEGHIGVVKHGKKYLLETYAGSMINSIISFLLTDFYPKSKVEYDFRHIEIYLKALDLPSIENALKIFIEQIHKIEYEEWVIFLEKHLSDLQYSRFSPYIPLRYSVHHAASAYYLLENVKKYFLELKK